LEAVKAAGEKLQIKVLGLATIAPDVTPALALATIESITVLGALHASKEIKNALADRALLLGREPVASELLDEQDLEDQAEATIDVTPEITEADVKAAPHRQTDVWSKGWHRQNLAPAPAKWPMHDAALTLRQGKLPSFGLDALARLRPRKALTIPEGAKFLERSYDCAAGSRKYKVYVPRHYQGGRCPLVVMLHGGTQDADDFAAGTQMNALAEEHGFIVVYPNQCKAANASLCWNWFKPEDQMRGAGEPSILAGITKEVMAEYDIDPERVFVAGLSAGGAMAAVMGETYPEIFAAVGVHSGLPYRSATDVVSAFAAMRGDPGMRPPSKRRSTGGVANNPRIRTIVFHGDADHIVHPSNAAKITELHTRNSDSVERVKSQSSASRPYSRTVTRDKTGSAVIEQWLVHGSGHAWSGGSPDGTYTDPGGPDASREMLRFFFEKLPSARTGSVQKVRNALAARNLEVAPAQS
jgi:poly(hydroxyalkanoate) depolymerase family esterase